MADATSEYAGANGWREIDLSNEVWREYHYAGGVSHRINSGGRLFVRSDKVGIGGESHRIVLADGVCIRPERGWIAITWAMHTGSAFVA